MSEYFYARKNTQHGLHQLACTKTMRDYFSQEETKHLINQQVRHITPLKQSENLFAHIGKESSERAIESLDDFYSFVGLTEYFDDSLARLQTQFGWDQVSMPPQNVTGGEKKQSKANPEDTDALRELIAEDVALYKEAEKRHLADVEKNPIQPVSGQPVNMTLLNMKTRISAVLSRYF